MSEMMKPGPRQTVERAKHPTLGEGIAVSENGPAFFQPDGGEPIPMREITFGGVGQDGSYRNAVTMTGERIELDTTDRPGGESHTRRWSPIFGPGWLVNEVWPVYPGDNASAADKARYEAARGYIRFEPDDGSAPIRWQWNNMRVGRKGREPKRPAKGKADSPARVEWEHWTTIDAHEFRDTPPADVPPVVSTQMAIPGA